MTITALWCRHINDNIIGFDEKIPWYVPSDLKKFKKVTLGQTLIVGRKTYESFPNRTLPNRKMIVISRDNSYELSDNDNHFLVSDLNKIKEFTDDLYLAGGESIYKIFMQNPELAPDFILDSVYEGELEAPQAGQNIIDISECIKIMQEQYVRDEFFIDVDNVKTFLWYKKDSGLKNSSKYAELLQKLEG